MICIIFPTLHTFQAIRVSPSPEKAYRVQGKILRSKGKLKDALDAIERSLALDYNEETIALKTEIQVRSVCMDWSICFSRHFEIIAKYILVP